MKQAFEETLIYCQPDTLEELLLIWQNQPFAPDTNLTDYRKWMQVNPDLEMILGMSPCLSWIIDIRTQQVVFVSHNIKNLIGYTAGNFRQNGLYFLNAIMHPADRPAVWRRTTELWKNLLQLTPSQRQNFRYNRKYRLRHAQGNFITLLEQNSVLQTDSAGNITHLLCIFSNISELLQKDTFRKSETMAPLVKTRATQPAREQNKGKLQLSTREQEIVKLVADGYSSKIIADRLFISPHTVNTHRRNILEKTHCRNTSGLVQFAINNRII
jgi:DNA-binding CsgD family transcriptional regulator/PAS domain-containing protein